MHSRARCPYLATEKKTRLSKHHELPQKKATASLFVTKGTPPDHLLDKVRLAPPQVLLHLHHQVAGDVRGSQVAHGGEAEARHEGVAAVHVHLRGTKNWNRRGTPGRWPTRSTTVTNHPPPLSRARHVSHTQFSRWSQHAGLKRTAAFLSCRV